MSLRNRRTAAATAIGLLAGGVPVGTASAASGYGPSAVPAFTTPAQFDPPNATDVLPTGQPSVDPQNDQADGTPSPPPAGDQSWGAECAQAALATTVPTVITCGPVTISFTFNTITTTTTITTVSAPITAANGPVTTSTTNPVPSPVANPLTAPAPATAVKCKPARRKKAKTRRPKSVKAVGTVKVRVRFVARPSR
jgi:hypothetical protein